MKIENGEELIEEINDVSGAAPADYSDSDEEENPVVDALNKQALLEWLTVVDFT